METGLILLDCIGIIGLCLFVLIVFALLVLGIRWVDWFMEGL